MNPVLFFLLVSIILLNPGCRKTKTGAGPLGNAKTQVNITRFDRLVAGEKDDGSLAAEAREWLNPKNTENALWKTSREQTTKMVDDLYAAGAAKVLAVYSPKSETNNINMCAQLLVVLPSELGARNQVFMTYNRIDKQIWGNRHNYINDVGQNYLGLNMDP